MLIHFLLTLIELGGLGTVKNRGHISFDLAFTRSKLTPPPPSPVAARCVIERNELANNGEPISVQLKRVGTADLNEDPSYAALCLVRDQKMIGMLTGTAPENRTQYVSTVFGGPETPVKQSGGWWGCVLAGLFI